MATHYHVMEQRIINRFYDKDGKNEFIPKLNEENAVKLGATIIAAGLIFEYRRSSLKEAAKEKQLQERLMTLEAQVVQLQEENDRVLRSMFPDERHERSSIDINYETEGWVSWLVSSLKQLSSDSQ
ncbi:hypothetical protein Emag_000918 [Eimeria magna]